MITVLFPSRGRPGSLGLTTWRLLDLAAYRENVEILVALDPDDGPSHDVPLPPQARTWTAPQRYGYAGQHHYYNHLLTMVRPESRWLLNWNDDALMETRCWDMLIGREPPGVLWPQANHAPHANTFPAWPRAWSDLIGHVTPSPHIDTYIQRLGDAVGLHRSIPVKVFHDRADVTGGHQDQTYAEGRALLGPEGMVPGGIPSDAGIIADAARIRAAVLV